MSQQIRQYWDDRARQHREQPAATTDDVYLRELESATLIERLSHVSRPGARVLDVGCGNGYTVLNIARALPDREFLGVDFSAGMVESAQASLAAHPELADRVAFQLGDVTALAELFGAQRFDVVVSTRCLINLPSVEAQSRALEQIAHVLAPGGYYLAIENFREGHEHMNQARRQVGLPEIPIRWHNLYFEEARFRGAVAPYFEDLELLDFSSAYYLATRVIYAAMCQMRGETPDYSHDIHQLAIRLPWVGAFSPIRLAVMRRSHG